MSRRAAALKAWETRRRGGGGVATGTLVRRKDVSLKRVSKRLASYIDFRHGMSGRLAYSARKQYGESRAQTQRRLGMANVKPLRNGILLTRRPSSVPGLTSSARNWIDGFGFPLGESKR